ncbi:T9SS type A sorting domain-containing protein [Saccharicrinis sp. FJH62]|uniref:T9SS type A sorting domain-containing protein n=1 Tax=Saccharicrinis sp. FJH62 TaxID=3344657 RepID=UPI0035D4E3A6
MKQIVTILGIIFLFAFNLNSQISDVPVKIGYNNVLITEMDKFHFEKESCQFGSDIKQRLDSVLILQLDTATDNWNLYQKKEFEFDVINDKVSIFNYLRDLDTEEWVMDVKKDYSQNENGNLIQYAEYEWMGEPLTWLQNWDETYLYDKKDILSEKTVYLRSSGNWHPFSHSEYSEMNNMTIEYEKLWDKSDSTFRPTYKKDVSYNSNGNISELTVYSWSKVDNTWKPNTKTDFFYDVYGNVTQYIFYFWNSRYTTFEISYKGEYLYNEDFNMSEYNRYIWDGKWKSDFTIVYNYDASYSTDMLLLPPNYVGLDQLNSHLKFGNKLIGRTFYNNGSKYTTKETYYYSEQSGTPVQNTVNVKYRLYPNPVRDFVEIDINSNDNVTFELYDLQGQCLLIEEVCYSKKVYVKNLSPGLYIYNLNVNGKRRSGKLLKE